MKLLYRKLSVAMLAIVLFLGGAFYLLERISVKLYYEELSQRLNSSLAMYVVNAKPLITDGITDTDALAELASRAMVINPTAEIYLLDIDGNILGHGLPDNAVSESSVNLGPIQDLMDGNQQLPIKGDDPSNPGTSLRPSIRAANLLTISSPACGGISRALIFTTVMAPV